MWKRSILSVRTKISLDLTHRLNRTHFSFGAASAGSIHI